MPVESFKTKVEYIGSTTHLTLPRTGPLREVIAQSIFMSLWLAMVIMVGARVIAAMSGRFPKQVFTVDTVSVFVLGMVFAALGVVALFLIVWPLAGRTTLTMGPDNLRVRRAIGPLGVTRDYGLASIRTFRIQHWVRGGRFRGVWYSLAFDYGSKTIAFGKALSFAELAHIRSLIFERAPGLNPFPSSSTSAE